MKAIIKNLMTQIIFYNSQTIDDGYYLDNNTNIFKPCYETCSKCSDSGD